jgi:hypothetical protein
MGIARGIFYLCLFFVLYASIGDVCAEYYPVDSLFSEYSYVAPGYAGRMAGGRNAVISLELDPIGIINNGLRLAAREDRVSDLMLLLKKGADVETKTSSGMSPLMFAARNCSSRMVEILISTKADVNAIDHFGRTPLIYATRESCWRVVELLVKVPGVKFLHRDNAHKTALDYASEDALSEVGGASQKIMGLILFSKR